jgi:protein-S-isoprenylcysteine O-methyltransferase Ste14
MPALDLAVLLGTVACVAVVLAAAIWNHLSVRAAGRVAERVQSPIATASMLAFFALVVVLLNEHVGAVVLPAGLRSAAMLVGLALLVAGAVVNVAGRLQLGRNWADHVTIYRDQQLVQRGVYGLVRHPLYASLTWMFVGAALVFRNAAALGATLAIFLPATIIRARQEERLLAARYPEYADYCRRVGMLLPLLGARKRTG